MRPIHWPRSGLVSHVEYDSNYNIYWSQKNVLRSWRIDQSLGIELQNRWAFAWDAYEEFQLFGSRKSSAIAPTGFSSDTTSASSSPLPSSMLSDRAFGAVQVAYERGTAPFGQRSERGNTLFLKFSHVF